MERHEWLVIVGIVLLIPLSLSVGVSQALFDVAGHLVKDFTTELLEHAFIAGLILIVFGIYRFWKKKTGKRK